MVTSCCVPECNQKGKKTPTGEKVSFFEFPRTPTRRNSGFTQFAVKKERILRSSMEQKFVPFILGEKI